MGLLRHIAVTLILVVPSFCSKWSYKTQDTWAKDYPDCGKDGQSPVHIARDDVDIDEELPIINRNMFDKPPSRMSVKNSGYSLKITFDEGGYELVDTKLLPFKAKIHHYHMHWGRNATSGGAEHRIDGKQYFAELHAVHYNTKYDNVSDAMNHSDGLAVFGWFIDVDYPQDNQDFANLLRIATGIVEIGGSFGIASPFSLESIIPADLNIYYRYKGSLTTPGCHESVVWTVFEEPIRISTDQVNELSQKIFDSNRNPIQDNFRQVQPLNGRQITKPPPLVPKSAGVSLTASTLLSFTSVLLVLLH